MSHKKQMSHNHIVLLNNPKSRKMVERLCEEHGFVFGVLEELIHAKITQTGSLRRRKLWQEFDDILDDIEIEE